MGHIQPHRDPPSARSAVSASPPCSDHPQVKDGDTGESNVYCPTAYPDFNHCIEGGGAASPRQGGAGRVSRKGQAAHQGQMPPL